MAAISSRYSAEPWFAKGPGHRRVMLRISKAQFSCESCPLHTISRTIGIPFDFSSDLDAVRRLCLNPMRNQKVSQWFLRYRDVILFLFPFTRNFIGASLRLLAVGICFRCIYTMYALCTDAISQCHPGRRSDDVPDLFASPFPPPLLYSSSSW